MSIASKASKILTNKMFLYFVFFLAITTVFGYLMTHNLNAVGLFALIGILTYQFSKNMAVVLLVCVLATNLIMSSRSMREGLENAKDSETPEKKTVPPPSSSSNNDSGPIVPVSEEVSSGMESMKNKANKKGGSGRIDYASTLEEAYDNLDQILGGDGIKNLTNDTQKLMAKQQELFQSMQAMTPMLTQAKQMLEGFDMKSLEGLAGIASSFTSSMPAMPSLPGAPALPAPPK